MARKAGSSGERTAEAIRAAGLRLIFRHGYEGMTLRDLAREVGLQAGSLYNHISTKQDLLFDLLSRHMRALTAALDDALAGIDDPGARLDAFVAFHVRYHLSRKAEVFVNNSELRSLDPENRKKIVALRKAYQNRLTDILSAGTSSGAFEIPDVRVAAYAILAQLTGVVSWYRPSGRLGSEEIIAVHRRLVFEGVRPSRRPPRKTPGRRDDRQGQ